MRVPKRDEGATERSSCRRAGSAKGLNGRYGITIGKKEIAH